jgi:hypothetical protein
MRKEKIDYYANQLADEKDPKVVISLSVSCLKTCLWGRCTWK